MTNPNDSVGTNAGYDGRTTPKAFNDILASLSAGVLSGWACSPKSGMTVQIGGGSDRDVAIAGDNAGNRTTINNRSGAPIEITLSGAPSTNNRIDAIVAYVDPAQSGSGATSVDFPDAVGFITVEGTIAANPSIPDDAAIRAAITADGSTGASAYYVILATILVGTSVTTIGSGAITAGAQAQLSANAGDNIATKAIEALSYKAGDTINISTGSAAGITITGFLTGGQQSLRAFIPLAKSLENISVATVTVFKCQARCGGAYLTGLSASDNWGDAVAKSGSVTVAVRPELGGLDVVFAKTSGNWGGTNNAPVSFEVQTLTVSLS